MSLPGTRPEHLESCPSCGKKNQLVIATYKQLTAIVEVDLECEGCCSVVMPLEKDDLARMRFTEAGRKILRRKSKL